MTILQGTMQDGTVLPVQVNAQGQLVAEGLQGAPGPAGPAGAPGPAGADGVNLVLPAGARSGDVLMWTGTGLQWAGSSIGPWRSDWILSKATNASPTYSAAFSCLTPGDGTAKDTFDGLTNTKFSSAAGGDRFTLTIDPSWKLTGALEVWVEGGPVEASVNGGTRFNVPVHRWVSLAPDASTVTEVMLHTSTIGTGVSGFRANGAHLIDGGSQVTLTLRSIMGLTDLNVGQQVKQFSLGSTGTVSAIDLATRQVSLLRTTGTWNPGAGTMYLERP